MSDQSNLTLPRSIDEIPITSELRPEMINGRMIEGHIDLANQETGIHYRVDVVTHMDAASYEGETMPHHNHEDPRNFCDAYKAEVAQQVEKGVLSVAMRIMASGGYPPTRPEIASCYAPPQPFLVPCFDTAPYSIIVIYVFTPTQPDVPEVMPLVLLFDRCMDVRFVCGTCPGCLARRAEIEARAAGR